MAILDFLKQKDNVPLAYKAAIKTAGQNNVKELTLNGARKAIIDDIKDRRNNNGSLELSDMMKDYHTDMDAGWAAMCDRVGITDSDIMHLMEECLMQPAGSAPLRIDKPGRNDTCPCGSGIKYKKCCGK